MPFFIITFFELRLIAKNKISKQKQYRKLINLVKT